MSMWCQCIIQTLVRHLVKHAQEMRKTEKTNADVLDDVVRHRCRQTSLPPKADDEIAQITEDAIGSMHITTFPLHAEKSTMPLPRY